MSSDQRPYDAYLSYNAVDETWVQEYLLPRLEADGVRVVTEDDFVVGVPRVKEIERAIRGSRCTVIVLTPEWLEDAWNDHELIISQTLDPAARKRKLIPVVLRPVAAPLVLKPLVKLDLTDERKWPKNTKKLAKAIFYKAEFERPPIYPIEKTWAEHWWEWWRWLRRYRERVLAGAAAVLALWAVLFTLLGWWPFHERMVWEAENLEAYRAVAIANTGSSLVVGRENHENGCEIIPKGLWYRPLPDGTWQESDVGDLLCIEERTPPALANIPALAASPDQRGLVFALTSHKGILVSTDGGATFQPHPPPYPRFGDNNLPAFLAVDAGMTPDLWVGTWAGGLWRVNEAGWVRMDGGGEPGCQNLPEVTVRSILVSDNRLLIGTDQQGLWFSADNGQTCRRVFDDAGRYEITKIVEVSSSTHQRYLLAVRDWAVDNASDAPLRYLYDLCPRPDSCTKTPWNREELWAGSRPIMDVFVQENTSGQIRWYLANSVGGQVWTGGLHANSAIKMPGITRCLPDCDMQFAADGDVPYLLAAEPSGIWPGRVYQFRQGPWWRRIWP